MTVVLIALLAATAILRIASLPARYDLRDIDEPNYLQGGLLLLEGLPVSYHYAPAGLQTWFSWGYAALHSSKYFISPTLEEAQVPLQVRAYTAVNHALFDIYRDVSGLRLAYLSFAIALSLVAVAAAYQLGRKWGGPAGAVLCGGLVAFSPLLSDFAVMARPYSAAFSCAVISVYFASVRSGPRGAVYAGVFAGLAVASRVEMLVLLPLAMAALGPERSTFRQFVGDACRFVVAAAFVALLVAPWLLTNLVGNLRAIASIRFGPAPGEHTTALQTLVDFGWNQGLAVAAALFLIAVIAAIGRWREAGGTWRLIVFACVLILLVPLLKQTGYGMRHQGPSIIALLLGSSYAGALVVRRWPRAGWVAVTVAVLLPLAQSVRYAAAQQVAYVPDDAPSWVNAHVPPGTIAYVTPSLRELLPTPESADAMWDQVMARDAAVEKFNTALARFQLGSVEMPRALSEQHMVVERSNARRWYILGSREQFAGPRFDIRRYGNSGVEAFSPKDPVPHFQRTGGILIWRGAPLPADRVGEPVASWVNSQGTGTFIYCSPDVRSRLRPE